MENFTHKRRTDLDHPQSRHWIAGVETTRPAHIQLPSFRDLELLVGGPNLGGLRRPRSYTTNAERNLMGPCMPGSFRSPNSKSSADIRYDQISQELLSAHERGRGFAENTTEKKISEPSANIDSSGRLLPIFSTPKPKPTTEAKSTSEEYYPLRRSPRKRIPRGLDNPEPASIRSKTSKPGLLPAPPGSQPRDATPVNVDKPTSGLRENKFWYYEEVEHA